MSNTTIALNLHVRDYLSEEVLEALSEALMKDLSKLALATLEKVTADNGIIHKVDASVLAKVVEKSAMTGPSAKEALESLAVHCEERAATFDAVASNWGPNDREQAYGDAGIGAGYRGGAEYARAEIKSIEAL